MRLSREDRATVGGIIAFLLSGFTSFFILKLSWVFVLLTSTIVGSVVGILLYRGVKK